MNKIVRVFYLPTVGGNITFICLPILSGKNEMKNGDPYFYLGGCGVIFTHTLVKKNSILNHISPSTCFSLDHVNGLLKFVSETISSVLKCSSVLRIHANFAALVTVQVNGET